MKRIFSKTGAIGTLVVVNMVLCGALFASYKGIRSWKDVKGLFSKQETTKPVAAAPKASVREATLKNDSRIQECYDSLLTRQPRVSEGAVVMHWIFNEQGQMDFLKLVRSDLEDQPFLDCLMETVKATRIPAADSRAGKLISHKFTFRNKSPGELEFE
jgi:hypothetical protein